MTDRVRAARRGGAAQPPGDVDGPAAAPPGPRLPEILGPGETAVWLWRRLRRMSTALWLLFALAAASVVATFIPQERVIPVTVAEWRAGIEGPGTTVASAFDALSLFDVYGSWWFIALVVALFVSLTGCLVPRWAAFLRQVRRPPAAGYQLERLTHRRTFATGLSADEALDAVERVMARRRFRRRRLPAAAERDGRPQLATERGHWREGGSLVFHSSFYVLLAGVVVGSSFGFVGQVNVSEGSGFTDTRISYARAEAGQFFSLDDHQGFRVRLEDFDAAWHPDLTPERFVSTVTIVDDGREVLTERVQVNEPLTYAGMTLYQMRFGMAPRVIVRSGEQVLFDEQVRLGQAEANAWRGAAKVSMADPQIALELLLVPNHDVIDGDVVSLGPQADNPRLFANLWVGDLGLERPVPATQFDREGGSRLAAVDLAEGEQADLIGGQLTVEFAEMTMWSGFQVAHQPGRRILVVAAVLILAGLIPSLYAYRRRIWAEARDGEVLLAGVALHRKDAFADEFDHVAGAVEAALAQDGRQRTTHKESTG